MKQCSTAHEAINLPYPIACKTEDWQSYNRWSPHTSSSVESHSTTPSHFHTEARQKCRVPEILESLHEDDLLIITADHGNDPVHEGTDHTREYVPLMVYSEKFENFGQLEQGYFSDISATILENFDLAPMQNGTSFLSQLK